MNEKTEKKIQKVIRAVFLKELENLFDNFCSLKDWSDDEFDECQ